MAFRTGAGWHHSPGCRLGEQVSPKRVIDLIRRGWGSLLPTETEMIAQGIKIHKTTAKGCDGENRCLDGLRAQFGDVPVDKQTWIDSAVVGVPDLSLG